MSEEPPKRRLGRVGRSLANRNFRRYLVGTWLSMMGQWMQSTAAAWLVFELTGSPMAIGLYAAVSLGPVLILGAYGGLIVDRFPRFQLMFVTQVLLLASAAGLVVITLMPQISIVLVFGIGLINGCVLSVENPLRRAFVRELVDDKELPNAIALNSTAATVARAFGPAIGGVMIAVLGVTWNFGMNALSYGAVIMALLLIDRSKLRDTPPTPRGRRQVRAGLSYALSNDRIWTILAIATVVGTFAWNYGVLMPVYSTVTFDGDASMYGILLATVGVGSFVGAVWSARAGVRNQVQMIKAVGLVGVSLAAAALAPSIPLAALAMFGLGISGTTVIIASQTNLQLRVEDTMIGRILALYSIAFIGTKPIGGVVAGWMMEISGPRLAFAVSALMVVLVAVWLGIHERRHVDRRSGRHRSETHQHEQAMPQGNRI